MLTFEFKIKQQDTDWADTEVAKCRDFCSRSEAINYARNLADEAGTDVHVEDVDNGRAVVVEAY